MQCPILRLCNYALKICPAMPSLNASRPQYLNEIGGRRHEGAAREDPPPPAQHGTACCESPSNIPYISSDFKSLEFRYFRRKSLGGATLCAMTADPRPELGILGAPRSPHDAPRSPPETPSSRQDAPRSPKRPPRSLPDAPRSP